MKIKTLAGKRRRRHRHPGFGHSPIARRRRQPGGFHQTGHDRLHHPLQRQRLLRCPVKPRSRTRPTTNPSSRLFSASSAAKANPTAAVVTKVTFPSATACKTAAKVSKCALVTYNLNSAKTGAALSPNTTGYAANVNGKWFMSDTTFCSLAKLAGVTCTG